MVSWCGTVAIIIHNRTTIMAFSGNAARKRESGAQESGTKLGAALKQMIGTFSSGR